ncbi:TIGR03571 family LLM class oxidoreductase [Halospeciosus flavus]|uniref:TIGR03571 family LLM class oxidoreductase n=1 Tax=Halospeciosus flavus TaxID=3032283 RepID=A0ABD5Z0S1_9EURY|nr:TIGR03571 family LLM class oxidoreductase [Halospeciosus flavus]
MPDHRNRGFERIAGGDDLSVGVFLPVGTDDAVPEMDGQAELAARAEERGFDAVWFRDVPTYWPKFGDAGHVYDPWSFLGHVAAHTEEVALATGAVVLPLRHPLHVAKAAASVDQLSDGRLVLGVASGDRPPEFPAFDVEMDERGELVRESVEVLRACWTESFPELDSQFGTLDGRLDVVPKPVAETVPLFVAGHAQQSREWIAEHADGWAQYTFPEDTLEAFVGEYREKTDERKPYVQSTRIRLKDDPTADAEPIHQGYAAGSEWVREKFDALSAAGVDHVAVGVEAGIPDQTPEAALDRFATQVLDAR